MSFTDKDICEDPDLLREIELKWRAVQRKSFLEEKDVEAYNQLLARQKVEKSKLEKEQKWVENPGFNVTDDTKCNEFSKVCHLEAKEHWNHMIKEKEQQKEIEKENKKIYTSGLGVQQSKLDAIKEFRLKAAREIMEYNKNAVKTTTKADTVDFSSEAKVLCGIEAESKTVADYRGLNSQQIKKSYDDFKTAVQEKNDEKHILQQEKDLDRREIDGLVRNAELHVRAQRRIKSLYDPSIPQAPSVYKIGEKQQNTKQKEINFMDRFDK